MQVRVRAPGAAAQRAGGDLRVRVTIRDESLPLPLRIYFLDFVDGETGERELRNVGVELGEAEPSPGRGSTDVGNVSYLAPTDCVSFPITEGPVPWHSQVVNEAANTEAAYDSMFIAGKVVALTGLEYLEDPAKIEEAKAEWQELVAERQG